MNKTMGPTAMSAPLFPSHPFLSHPCPAQADEYPRKGRGEEHPAGQGAAVDDREQHANCGRKFRDDDVTVEYISIIFIEIVSYVLHLPVPLRVPEPVPSNYLGSAAGPAPAAGASRPISSLTAPWWSCLANHDRNDIA
ncbi:hypothetical protein V5F40_00545 [Xanthobacter sp. DSM 14520]|uniref:hypothetical protein n=1 Tax=Xanthobacter autotrophicus (strain ATCC BAA-1158 / Py2) TaxID=78245 RepID=UPI00372A8308